MTDVVSHVRPGFRDSSVPLACIGRLHIQLVVNGLLSGYGVNEARRLYADQKLRVDRLMAAGEDAREAQETLGLLEAPHPTARLVTARTFQFWRDTASICREKNHLARLGK
jgi:hypothetical protein